MDNEYAVYDTVWERYVGGVSADQAAQQTIAAALTTATGRAHTVVQVEAEPPGVTETAYFLGTLTGDTGAGEVAVDLAVDTAHGELPEWVTVVDGEAVLDTEAGGCFTSLLGRVAFDFSGTDAPDDPGHLFGVFTLKQNGDTVDSSVVDVPGDGGDDQTTEMPNPVGGFTLGGTISVLVNGAAFTTAGESDPVNPDADTVATVAVNITRVAPAPTLPE